MRKVIYTEGDISNIRALLNGVTLSGIQNCRQITIIAQILDTGKLEEMEQEEEGEG